MRSDYLNIFEIMHEEFKFKHRSIRLFEAFSGIGSQFMALKRLGIEVEVVGYSEIDKYAIQVYEALHGKHKNYGGIGSFERLPKDIDICTWSFPCQDISLVGHQKGMNDGTKSNYGYIFLETVENTPYNERPKVLLMENVRALFSEKFNVDWREIQLRLENMGYTSYSEILNAKDYGVAQNRERVFIVSILGEYYYEFPKTVKLTKRLKDYLEDEVDEKYYLKSGVIQKTFIDYTGKFERLKIFTNNVNRKEVSQTVTTKMDRAESQYITEPFEATIMIPEATKQGYAMAQDGDGVYLDRPHQKRGVVQKGMIQTIKTSGSDVGVITKDLRIRKLTPREALRLMDVSESDIDIILSEVSNTQAYKLAGNSIVVNVLVEIFRKLF
jgi:DNA (cytosine-5)-methyltransferase 1